MFEKEDTKFFFFKTGYIDPYDGNRPIPLEKIKVPNIDDKLIINDLINSTEVSNVSDVFQFVKANFDKLKYKIG